MKDAIEGKKKKAEKKNHNQTGFLSGINQMLPNRKEKTTAVLRKTSEGLYERPDLHSKAVTK